MPSYCAVYGCKNYSKYPGRYVVKNHVTFLRFHSCKPEYFKIWTELINRKDFTVSRATKVCSNHFRYAQPFPDDPHPSLYLRGYDTTANSPKRPTPTGSMDAPTPKKRRLKDPTHRSVAVQVAPEDFNGSVCHDHLYTHTPPTIIISNDYVRHLEEKIVQLREQLEQVNRKLKPKMILADIDHSDSLKQLYSGLPSYNVLKWLLSELKTQVQNLHNDSAGSCSQEDKLWQITNTQEPGVKGSQPVADELLTVLME